MMTIDTIAEENGLTLLRRNSLAEPVQEYDTNGVLDLLNKNFRETAAAVLWLDNRVEIALFHQDDFKMHCRDSETFSLKNIQRMRVFDQKREFHLWRDGTSWHGRLRTDDTGEVLDIVVARQLLFGTGKPKNNKEPENPPFTTITEDRGTTLHLPLKGIEFTEEGKLRERIFIKTHNYIKANSAGQSGYVDCRFVGFCALPVEEESPEYTDLELAG